MPLMRAAAANSRALVSLLSALLAASQAALSSSKLAVASTERLPLTARATFRTRDLQTVDVVSIASAAATLASTLWESSQRRYNADNSAEAPNRRSEPNNKA